MRLLGIILLALAPAVAAANTEHFKLDNGLEVLVKPDHRSKAVVSQIWYKVGASYEPAGKSGLSHLLEHMMFQGTKHLKPGQFAQKIQALGGQINAATGYDYTFYYEKVPRDKLKQALEMEAERMQHLELDPERFKKEKQVVLEELRLRVQDDPQGLTYQRLQAAHQLAHPYHNPIGGWREDVRQLTLEDLSMWYDRWYSPNNAIVVLVGDIEPGKAKKLVSQAFQSVNPQELAEPAFQKQPEPVGSKSVRVNAPAKLPWLAMAYQTPVYKTFDDKQQAYALQVLQAALTMGRDSLLQRQLVRQKQLVARVNSHYTLWRRLNGSFVIEATPANGVNARRVRRAVLNELEQLRRKPMDKSQLQRAKRQLIAQNTFQKDSLFYQAYELGRLGVVNLPPDLIDNLTRGIKSVTARDVQKAAKLYLDSKRLTSARLIPETINKQQETE